MKELNLSLHGSSYRCELDRVAQVPTPMSEKSWVPIPHISVHQAVEKAIAAAGLRIVTQVHALAANDQHYFGMYQVVNGKENAEMGLVLGTRNSHDKKFVAGIAAGEGVFACDNLAFWAEVVLGRKHTTFINRDLPVICNRAVGMLAEKWTDMENRVAVYKQHELNDVQVNDFLIRSVDAGAINYSNIPDVLKEWRTPSIPEFSAAGRCAWRLFNAYTKGYKRVENPAILIKRSQVLHGLMDTECGILLKDKVIDVEAIPAVVNN
jgi:hypothetical protein